MGNWRRVRIVGTCGAEDIDNLRRALDPGRDYANFHPLVCGGVCGLPNWAGSVIDVTGNLAERGYDEEAVLETLETLSKTAPSLAVKVHMGGDNETDECVATVVLADGAANVEEPEIDGIPSITDTQMQAGLMSQLMGSRS